MDESQRMSREAIKIENFQCFQRVHCDENYNDFNRILIIFTALISAVNQTSLKAKKDEDPSSSFYLQHLTD